MFSGFHVCSPYCGFCKPPKRHAIICEECGWTDLEGVAVGLCPKCGSALPAIEEPEPAFCRYVDAICANPCGKGRLSSQNDAKRQSCPYHTAW